MFGRATLELLCAESMNKEQRLHSGLTDLLGKVGTLGIADNGINRNPDIEQHRNTLGGLNTYLR
jgi:hypothetical protein